jgi:hypothetical protein
LCNTSSSFSGTKTIADTMTAGASTEVDILVRTHGTEVGSALFDTGPASGHPKPAWDLPDLWAQPDPPDQLDLPELSAPLDPQDPLDPPDLLAPSDLPAPLDPQDPQDPPDLLAPLDPSDLLDPQGPPGLLVRPGLMLAAVPTKIGLELVNIERAFARPVSRLQSPDPISEGPPRGGLSV